MTTTRNSNGIRSKFEQQRQHLEIFDFSANPHPTSVEDYKKQFAYEEKLIALFIAEYRRTGMCDYPILEEIAKLAQAGSVLLPKQAQRLYQKLDKGIADIDEAALLLKQNFDVLEDYLISPDEYSSEKEDLIEKSIKFNTKIIGQAIHSLLDISQKYAKPASRGLALEEDSVPELIKKLMADIQYIWKYLNEQAHINTVKSELTEGAKPGIFFRRLRQYLDVLPGYCSNLADLTRPKIQDKVAGTKFNPSEGY